jgi:hypothetical protein
MGSDRPAVLAAVFFFLALPPPAAAQAPGVAENRPRLRLTHPCDLTPSAARLCRTEGRWDGVPGDTIRVATAASVTAFPAAVLQRVEIHRGQRSHRAAGAGIGFVAGGVATYLVLNAGGSRSLCDRDANQDAMSSGECWGLTLLGGAVGAGLGAVVGGFIRSEKWEDIPVERLRDGSPRDQ